MLASKRKRARQYRARPKVSYFVSFRLTTA